MFGHDAATARLEGSKAFAKDFMFRHRIPCAASATFFQLEPAEAAIRDWQYGFPIVLKADGLAAGKGVVVADRKGEALETLRAFMGGRFGDASRTVVLEEPLIGMEMSLHVLVDVDRDHAACAVLPPCQDHKRIFDGDKGPNTGGMGAFGPLPFLRPQDQERLTEELVNPTIRGLQADGLTARGVLFLGVMWTPRGPRLLDTTCASATPRPRCSCSCWTRTCPPAAGSGPGAPAAAPAGPAGRLRPRGGAGGGGLSGTPRKGDSITLAVPGDITVIHAGTRRASDGVWITQGGRVLGLVACAPTWPRPGTGWPRPWSRCAGRACRRDGTSASGP